MMVIAAIKSLKYFPEYCREVVNYYIITLKNAELFGLLR